MAQALMGAGLGLETFGNYQASQATAASLKEQASQARQNAISAKAQANAEAQQQVIQSRKVIGEQVADYSAGGLEGGSVLAVMADSMINAEMDRLSILYGGNVRAQNFMSEYESKIRGSKDIDKAGIFGLLAGGFKTAGTLQE